MSYFQTACKKMLNFPICDDAYSDYATRSVESYEHRFKPEYSLRPNKTIFDLAWELKLQCNNKGIENDCKKSAEIIYKIGLEHFKMSPDKISLIKCIGLLNSAIARNPNNVFDIKQDLYYKCQHILQLANAKNQTTDLLLQASIVKAQIESMRNATNEALQTMKELWQTLKANTFELKEQQKHKIDSMKAIQEQIATQYKKIMINISKHCSDVMGQPPCKFAIVGMGSLARKEITPYSDFEHLILLENQENYEKHLEYFRWFSVIFHVIILNLQETIIPSLNIIHLNDKTAELGDWFFDKHANGISFDGMMPHACKFPLGKTKTTEKSRTIELIKPVNKMLEYLSCKDSFVNDYHLSDILLQTCFVYGDPTLHEEFETGIRIRTKSKSNKEIFADKRHQIHNDTNAFGYKLNFRRITRAKEINVKLLFYRTSTLMVTAFGKIFDIHSSSCFGIINKLAKEKKISNNAKHKLSFAVAIACEIRLSVYMNAKSQHDYIQARENERSAIAYVSKFLDVETIVSYFQITYCLHREIRHLLKFEFTYFLINESFLNFLLFYALNLDEMLLSLAFKYNFFHAITVPQRVVNDKACGLFDKCLAKLEKDTNFEATLPSQKQLLSLFRNLCDIAHILLFNRLVLYDIANILQCTLDVFQCLTVKGYKLLQNDNADENAFYIGHLSVLVATVLLDFRQLDEASEYMSFGVDLQSNNPKYTFLFYLLAGNNWFKMKQYEKSLHSLQIALGIRLSTTIRLDLCDHLDDYLIAMMYSGIGACLLKLNQYGESLIYLNIALQVKDDYRIENISFSTFAFSPATAIFAYNVCLEKL